MSAKLTVGGYEQWSEKKKGTVYIVVQTVRFDINRGKGNEKAVCPLSLRQYFMT